MAAGAKREKYYRVYSLYQTIKGDTIRLHRSINRSNYNLFKIFLRFGAAGWATRNPSQITPAVHFYETWSNSGPV